MSNKVTFGEIIEAFSRKTGFSKQKSEAFIKALIGEIKEELQDNGKASITNFGSFQVKEVAEREGQNPQTGEPITIPAHKRVSFTPYKALREQVNEKYAHLESELIGEKKEAEKAETSEEPKQEPEKNTDEPKSDASAEAIQKTFKRSQRPSGNNKNLILIAVLILAIIALVTAWFLTRPSGLPETAVESTTQMEEEPPSALSDQNEAENEYPIEEEQQPQQQQEQESAQATDTEEEAPADENAAEADAAEQEPVAGSAESMEVAETYQVNEDEWYWVIAEEVYGKNYLWPLIFSKNFSVDTHPDSLEENTRLEIPALMGTAENPAKDDYGNLAEASRFVSEAYRNFGNTDKADEYARYAEKWERKSNADD